SRRQAAAQQRGGLFGLARAREVDVDEIEQVLLAEDDLDVHDPARLHIEAAARARGVVCEGELGHEHTQEHERKEGADGAGSVPARRSAGNPRLLTTCPEWCNDTSSAHPQGTKAACRRQGCRCYRSWLREAELRAGDVSDKRQRAEGTAAVASGGWMSRRDS